MRCFFGFHDWQWQCLRSSLMRAYTDADLVCARCGCVLSATMIRPLVVPWEECRL
jgi:transcription initiation factor TFIIIB Brf1 subunit/transcription initiation factor TFIIB